MINREIVYERNLTGSYMKIPVSYDGEFDEKMMLKRKLPGLLPVEKCFVNGNGQYWYHISGKQSLDTYCRMKPIGIDFVKQMIVSICSEIEILEWNLLKPNILLLDPELIFVTNSNQEIIFTVYPGAKTEVAVEFQQLMEYLLTKIDHQDASAVHTAYAIYEKTLNEGYSLMDIRDSLIEVREDVQEEVSAKSRIENYKVSGNGNIREDTKESVKESTLKSGKKSHGEIFKGKLRKGIEGIFAKEIKVKHQNVAIFQIYVKELLEKWRNILLSKDKSHKKGEKDQPITVTYPGGAEPEEVKIQESVYPTICLTDYREHPEGILLYEGKDNFSNIRLEGSECRIGKGEGVDAVIAKDTISHFHAKIDCENQEYYIEDLNSTNGTFINEETLSYKERRQLKPNDIIRFADVRYRFL